MADNTGADLTVTAPQNLANMDASASMKAIEKEIRGGLMGHTDRLDAARDNVEFYHGRNLAYIRRRESEEFIDYVGRPKRTSKITRKVVRKLTEDLYNPGPTRKLENGTAEDAWLQQYVYAPCHVNALMQCADRMATLNATCAIQAVATGRPEKPLDLFVWGAESFVPFFRTGDHTDPWAVVTITLVVAGNKKHRRLELWSKDEFRVYTTKEVDVNSTAGGTIAQFRPDLSGTPAGVGLNPYGVLPFTFVHDEMPITDFWEGGFGTSLRDCNQELDRELSDLAQHAWKFLNPDKYYINVSANQRDEKRPGGWQHLRPGLDAEGDAAKEPKAVIVQTDMRVQEVWMNIMNYANCTLEELDVPLVAIREDASTDLSGIAIVAKHLPLLARTKARQVPFGLYETKLATLALNVCGTFYSIPQLAAAGTAPSLLTNFPPPSFPLPTPERDAADLFELEQGWTSELMIVQKRYGMTREQALDHLKQVAKDRKQTATIFTGMQVVAPGTLPVDPNAAAATNTGGPGGGPGPTDGTQDDEAAQGTGQGER